MTTHPAVRADRTVLRAAFGEILDNLRTLSDDDAQELLGILSTAMGGTGAPAVTPDTEALRVAALDAKNAWHHYFNAEDRGGWWTPLCEAMDRLTEVLHPERAALQATQPSPEPKP